MQPERNSVLANKNLPNCISAVRIMGTAALLFIDPLSSTFLVVYTISGVTDVLDGFIARRMGTTSELGAKLDSIADLLLYAVMLIKIFPVLWAKLPAKIWIYVGVVLIVRACSYGLAAAKYHRFSSQHTYMNKASGLAVFGVPYAIATPIGVGYCWMVCAVTMLASAEELLIHITAKEYDPKTKTIIER